MEEELGGICEGNIYYAGRGEKGAETDVEAGIESIGCIYCKVWEEEGGFLGLDSFELGSREVSGVMG